MKALGIVCLVAVRAYAQPAPTAPTAADQLFEEGRALAKAGKWQQACDRFGQSFILDHAVGTELNLGDCNEQLGHVREAWRLFMAAAKEFDGAGNATRAKFAHDRAEGLVAKLVTIVVKVAQPQQAALSITIGGRAIPPAAEIRDVDDPGLVEITATAAGYKPFTTSGQSGAGTTLAFEVPALQPDTPLVAQEGERARGRVHVAWGLGGGGAATALLSLVLSLKAKGDWNTAATGAHCTTGVVCDSVGGKQIQDAQHLADLGTAFALTSVALVAASAIVWYTAPREAVDRTALPSGSAAGRARVATVAVTPTATAQSVGVALSTQF